MDTLNDALKDITGFASTCLSCRERLMSYHEPIVKKAARAIEHQEMQRTTGHLNKYDVMPGSVSDEERLIDPVQAFETNPKKIR